MAHRETFEIGYEIKGARATNDAQSQTIEFGYEIEGAKDAGVTITDEMRARAKRLAQESHDSADGPASFAS